MKILIYTQYFRPETNAAANRTTDIAKYLSEKHDVNVLTGFPNHPLGKLIGDYKIKWLALENYFKVKVWRSFLIIPKKNNSKIWRYLNYFSFAFSSFLNLFRLEKPDVLFVSSPPISILILAYVYSKIKKTRLIVDIRDLWPEAAISLKFIKKTMFTSYLEKLVLNVYKYADKIIINTPAFGPVLKSYGHDEKVFYIPNGFDIAENSRLKNAGVKNNARFKVFYAGLFGYAQNVNLLVETARVASLDKSEVDFVLVGAGPLKQDLEEKKEKYGLKNIIIYDYQPKDTLFKLIDSCDLGVITYEINDTFRKNIPSKIFDYMFLEKPVLINLEGIASDIIVENDFGFVLETNDPTLFYNKIIEIKEKEDLEKKGDNAYSCLERDFNKQKLLGRLEKIIIQ